jgi:hypothetical protein
VPLCPPPACYDGTPHRYLLRRGTCLWRVHDRKYQACAFNPNPADPLFGGARFDATPADQYPFSYLALDEETALSETLLRDRVPDEWGMRVVNWPAVAGRSLSGLALTRDIELVSLISGRDLAAIGQDGWLVITSGGEYAQTRAWAHWIRRQAPWAHGLVWSSLRDRGGLAVVLFGDRCAAAFGPGYEQDLLREIPELAVELDDDAGAGWLNTRLAPYRAVIDYPPGGAPP